MSKLYIVPTPIGNLEDMTFRAIRVLKEVDLILAEDTRTSSKLLKHFEIGTHMHSHHMHNEHKTVENIIARLKSGETIALISDAGTPAISDPGFLLTRACVENKIGVECLPGATAFVPALVNSGLPNDKFVFEGFLPPKDVGREKRLESLKDETRTIIFYESPHRVEKTLRSIAKVLNNPRVTCAREITKKFEEVKEDLALTLAEEFKNKSPRGEFVIVLNLKQQSLEFGNEEFCVDENAELTVD